MCATWKGNLTMSLIAGNLGIIQRLLSGASMPYGIYGGAAVHLYGDRRPINNIDMLVSPGTLRTVFDAMKQAKRVGQFDGRRIMWSGINLYDDLSIRNGGATCAFKFDQVMIDRLRQVALLGSRVMVLAPEDVVAQKLLVAHEPGRGEQAHKDIAAILQRQTLDLDYLHERLRVSNALLVVKPDLEALGLAV